MRRFALLSLILAACGSPADVPQTLGVGTYAYRATVEGVEYRGRVEVVNVIDGGAATVGEGYTGFTPPDSIVLRWDVAGYDDIGAGYARGGEWEIRAATATGYVRHVVREDSRRLACSGEVRRSALGGAIHGEPVSCEVERR